MTIINIMSNLVLSDHFETHIDCLFLFLIAFIPFIPIKNGFYWQLFSSAILSVLAFMLFYDDDFSTFESDARTTGYLRYLPVLAKETFAVFFILFWIAGLICFSVMEKERTKRIHLFPAFAVLTLVLFSLIIRSYGSEIFLTILSVALVYLIFILVITLPVLLLFLASRYLIKEVKWQFFCSGFAISVLLVLFYRWATIMAVQ